MKNELLTIGPFTVYGYDIWLWPDDRHWNCGRLSDSRIQSQKTGT